MVKLNTMTSANRYYLTWIVVGSIILKLIVFLALVYCAADFTLPDSPSYMGPATQIINNGDFLYNKALWMRTPLYPLIIAGLYSVFGTNLYSIVIFQIICSAFLVINAYRIAVLISDVKAGLWIAMLVSVDYLYITYANLIMTDLLCAVILSYIFYYSIFFIKNNKHYQSLIMIGILLAASTLMRPITYYLTPCLAIFLFFYTLKKENFIRAGVYFLILVIPSFLLVGGWQIRNKHVIGTYQYTSIDAVNVYHYYAADNLSHQQGISVEQAQQELENKAERLFPGNKIEKYNYYRSEGMKILLHNMSWSVVQGISGLLRTLFGNDYILMFYNNGLFLHAKALENDLFNRHYSNFFQNITMIDCIKLSLIAVFFIFNFLLVASSVYFIISTIRSRSPMRPAIMILLLFLGYFLLVSSNYCAQARFRLPFEVIFNCFAVLGCYSFFGRRTMQSSNASIHVMAST